MAETAGIDLTKMFGDAASAVTDMGSLLLKGEFKEAVTRHPFAALGLAAAAYGIVSFLMGTVGTAGKVLGGTAIGGTALTLLGPKLVEWLGPENGAMAKKALETIIPQKS